MTQSETIVEHIRTAAVLQFVDAATQFQKAIVHVFSGMPAHRPLEEADVNFLWRLADVVQAVSRFHGASLGVEQAQHALREFSGYIDHSPKFAARYEACGWAAFTAALANASGIFEQAGT